MPMTAMAAGAVPSSGRLARITAFSAACSTATHTEVSAAQTSVTSSMPSRSAEAMRASSRRRSERAMAMERTGSLCRPAEATNAPATVSGSDVEQLGSRRPVAVVLDDLGCAHQQLRHVRRRAEHMHQPLGHRRLVPQRRQKPALADHHLADPAVGQQPGIWVGGVGQPVQQPWQQHRLHPAPTAALVDQRGQMGQRTLRRLVAQRGQLTFGGRGRHALGELQAFWRKRFQQRLVEELGVQPRHPQVRGA